MQEVSEFIIVAPATMGKAIERSEFRLSAYLSREFPHYSFRIEPYGPLSDDIEFTVIPVMNRSPAPGELRDPDELFMCRPLDPRVIPQIVRALRDFDLSGAGVH